MSTLYGKSSPVPAPFAGIADFVLDLPVDRPIRILQLTDMQIIDASRQRTPNRLNEREIALWQPESIPVQCADQIKSVVAQANPDLIFITGDVIYGEFDDLGTSFELFCDFMDGFGIPWAPVYGNHDNESRKGIDWQNGRFEAAELCLFKKGSTTGNGNFSVLITRDGQPCRALYLMDSGACMGSPDASVRRGPGFTADQYDWLYATADRLTEVSGGTPVPAFLGFHIPTIQFHQAAVEKGYQTSDEQEKYVIGVTSPAKDGDFGCKREPIGCFGTPEDFVDRLHGAGIDGVFVGHCHANNTSVLWRGIRWTYGLKTGQYDYRTPGQLGGTLITLWGADFTVCHLPTLSPLAESPNPPRH
jgi:hypothetical protein